MLGMFEQHNGNVLSPIGISFGWSLGEYLHEHIFFEGTSYTTWCTPTCQLVSCKLVHTNISLEAYVKVQVEPVFAIKSQASICRKEDGVAYEVTSEIYCNCIWSWEVVAFFHFPAENLSTPPNPNTSIREIPQKYHIFALFDPPKLSKIGSHLMIPVLLYHNPPKKIG